MYYREWLPVPDENGISSSFAITDKLHFSGRLGLYRYFDMDDCIESAMNMAEKWIPVLDGNKINYPPTKDE